MAFQTIREVATTLPSAVAGVYNLASDLSSKVSASCLFSLGKSVVSLKAPSLNRITCAYKEVKDLANFARIEGSALRKKFRKVDEKAEIAHVMNLLQNAPTKEAYFQILTQNAVYLNLSSGTIFAPSEKFDCPIYQVKNVLEFPEGLKVMSVVSVDKENEAPLVIVRGTDPKNIHNLADDVVENIAEMNTTKYSKELEDFLLLLAGEHGRIHIIGHSYGGAVAERLTSKHPELIKRLSPHNSPGVGKKIVDLYLKNIAKLPAVLEKPHIETFRHAKDIVSLLGGEHLPTDKAYTLGSTHDAISHIDAHSLNTLSTNAPKLENATIPDSFRKHAQDMEKRRLYLSKIIPIYRVLKGG